MAFSIEFTSAPFISAGGLLFPGAGLESPIFIGSLQDEIEVGGNLVLTVGAASTQSLVTYGGIAADGSIQITTIGGSFYLTDATITAGSPLPAIDTGTSICFAAGTLIATTRGDVAVEDLTPEDEIVTATGETAKVRWVGHQTRSTIFGASEKVCPVRIAAGALGENLPVRDLTVTADHGIVFEQVIVHASALVNGTTITRVAKAELGANVTYYHVETEGHAVLMAEGCPAETFIDNVSRERFDNFAEFVAAYGADQDEIQPLDLPRAKGPRQVPTAIKARIADRAAILAGDLTAAV